MWIAWFWVGLALLVTKRYAKKFWLPMHFLHAILGYFTLIVTIVFVLKVVQWEVPSGPHTIIGWIVVIVTIPGALSGVFTVGTMRFYTGDKPWTEKERVERVAKIHRYFGYFMLLLGNVGVTTGLGNYYNFKLKELVEERNNWKEINTILFLVLVITFEVIYRLRNKYSKGQIETPGVQGKIQSFTPKSIDDEVAKGRKLVIFDNLVLELHDDYIH